ncbi:alcohol dehydrogenase catalytic domain-containing protein [Pseudogemmobacter bohemicus]|uniref:alcohol dehydrogenase catalytic domain-containing protein n=1 Tax=Pseudogemmobacter bohemicus TaxID=2250708 RepID=UPI000DD3F454|nr:alcohol dehydrogenase catalytic domain-containing protein [Pseudogemmobacter bohemicus]
MKLNDVVLNRHWPHRGGTLEDLLRASPEAAALTPPAADELIARVEAVSICSSDIKIVRMGASHPLIAGAAGAVDTVLGHEVSLRVTAVGQGLETRFHPGQRLSLQPAMVVNGKRSIIGMDRPGGFAQYLRLGPEALAANVMEAPEDISAADIALLEPYGCVERAWRPNVRQSLCPGGRALVMVAPGARFTLSDPLAWGGVALIGARPDFLSGQQVTELPDLASAPGPYDDILALGDISAADLSRLVALLAPDGMLLQGRSGVAPGPVDIDPARIHYDRLALIGTPEPDLAAALRPGAQRFDTRPGGVALIHGAGGAMGRIHVHRLLQLQDGPRVIIASSRKGQRLSDLEADFGPLALAAGRRLVLADAGGLAAAVAEHAPGGLDDVVVVAPDPAAVELAAGWLAPDGLLALFAGFPYGRMLAFDLAGIALTGKRVTGSTGCSLDDMRDVLARVRSGALDLSANIAAVAGLDQLPQALQSVAGGAVSGKIIIYPQVPDLPLRPVRGWSLAEEAGLTG